MSGQPVSFVLRSLGLLMFFALLVGVQPIAGYSQLSKPTALLKGEVRSEEDQSTVSGLQVSILKGTDRVATSRTNSDGKFTAVVPPGAQYRINYRSKDFAFREDTINVPTADKYQEVAVRATVMPLRDNQDFTPRAPVFKRASAAIETVAGDRLDQLAALVRKNARLRLEIMVYPDHEIHSKKDAAQQRLLDSRATSLRSFFMSRHVNAANVTVTAMQTVAGATSNALEPIAIKGKKAKKPAAAAAPASAAIAQSVKITGRLSS
jgi:hypothetical protein